VRPGNASPHESDDLSPQALRERLDRWHAVADGQPFVEFLLKGDADRPPLLISASRLAVVVMVASFLLVHVVMLLTRAAVSWFLTMFPALR
jgi:hypothetical protein